MDPDGSNNKVNRKINNTAKQLKNLDENAQTLQAKTLLTEDDSTEEHPLRVEWSLFWDGLFGDHSPEVIIEDSKKETHEPVRVLTRENIQTLIKELSNQRKQLHKQIEQVNKEIELNSEKLESLRLVGSEPEETINLLNELSDKGQELSLQLEKLDQKLKWVRGHEKEPIKEPLKDKNLA